MHNVIPVSFAMLALALTIEQASAKPANNVAITSPFKLTSETRLFGAAAVDTWTNDRRESPVPAVRLSSRESTGSASWTATISPGPKRWYRFRIRALAEEDVRVDKDNLYLRVDFFKNNGKNDLDHITKSIYEHVERDRKDLADAGTNRNLGSATWRYYTLDFRTPFPQIDTLKLTAGFGNGTGKSTRSDFWISEVELSPIPDPADYVAPKSGSTKPPSALKDLVKMGGRWYYGPAGSGSQKVPDQFDHTNADRLYYFTDRLETPFAGNMSAWLRKGYLDLDEKLVEQDRFIEDNVIVSFTDKHLVIKTHNLPNHPTAVFPDRSRFLDGNPNHIQEQNFTWHIPLEPKENPNHVAMDATNSNRALPGGPIGVSINGIILHNPFDERVEMDAVYRLDRCCGHPSPRQAYHYHKYPVCIFTPWSDDGTAHSPLLGFAFDGFPIYGPYESADELAKDSKANPLNDFNLHTDAARGPHYHVTPGKYPHLIGGYWGEVETLNRPRRGPPR